MVIKVLEETESTNSYMKNNFDMFSHFDVLTAKHQTAGYGRFKRVWFDLGTENIYMSLAIKSTDFIAAFSNITQYTSLILARTFVKYSVNPIIKWPNDILINNNKVSGILAESVLQSGKFKGIVLGIGINLNASEKDFLQIDKNVTSLNIETGFDISKDEFIKLFLDDFYKNYDEFIINGFKSIRNEYLERLDCIGKKIIVMQSNSSVSGIVKTINDDGLLILDSNGKNIEISTGDVN